VLVFCPSFTVQGIESEELYIVAADSDDTNTKIRDGTLDIKVLIETCGDLERWRPRTKYEFPLTAAMLEDEVLPQLGVAMPQLSRDKYALEDFLEELVLPHRSWPLPLSTSAASPSP
jgi:hypothetical protein